MLGSTEAFIGPSLAIFASPDVFSRLRAAATSANTAEVVVADADACAPFSGLGYCLGILDTALHASSQ